MSADWPAARTLPTFVVYATVDGDLNTVKTFVSHGVPLEARTRDGLTALHGAARGGSLSVLEYLVSKGANVNALDLYGDSPLEMAISRGHDEAAKFLASHGAQRIRGDNERRQRATEEIVREAIQEMKKRQEREQLKR